MSNEILLEFCFTVLKMNKTENKTTDIFKLQPQTQNSIELLKLLKRLRKILLGLPPKKLVSLLSLARHLLYFVFSSAFACSFSLSFSSLV